MPTDSKLHLDWLDFYGYLSDFEDSVYDGLFQKIEYNTWRKLKHHREIKTQVTIEKCDDSFIVMIGYEDEYHRFYRGDGSFGDFIFENLIDVEKYGNHLVQNYNTIESTKNIAINCGEALKSSSAITKDELANNGIMSISTNTSPSKSCVIDTKVDKAEFEKRMDDLTSKVESIFNKYENKKESSTMKGFNFDFGSMNGNVVRMSIYGLAVKNKTGSWVAYDAKNEEIMDVDVFNFDGSKFMYRMPVAINDVAAGDVIVHMSVPMFVVGKSEDGKAVYAVDPVAGERKEIMLVRSPFGFNFVVKVINLLDGVFNGVQPSADNPFGNILPFLLMDEGKIDNPMLLMALSGNADFTSNPMMLYFLLKDGKSGSDESLMPLLFMMNANGNNNHTCKCHQGNSN